MTLPKSGNIQVLVTFSANRQPLSCDGYTRLIVPGDQIIDHFVSYVENYKWFRLALLSIDHRDLTPSPANHRVLEAGAPGSGEEDVLLSM